MRLQKITLGKKKKWQDYDKTRLHCESNSGLWDRKNKKWQE